MSVAALFVRRTSIYKQIEGVDAYDEDRNALEWPGGVPGVFHPPCRSWGKLRQFAKPAEGERELALWAVAMARRFGGIVEHPLTSGLWRAVDCRSPGIRDDHGGVLIPIFQSWWGHRAQKATGLYIVGPVPDLPPFTNYSSVCVEHMCRAERERTPPEFARYLVNAAAACKGWV